MPETPDRPAHLPDYLRPPLDEVVLGVQFAPARGYQQIRAGEVWALYRDEFPAAEEHPPIPPAFETFGIPFRTPTLNLSLVVGPTHNRFWFVSPDRTQLIQFQQDRLLHNWRKTEDEINEYPRFERIIVAFNDELVRLETYFDTLEPQKIVCNQAEISYVNKWSLGPASVAGTASQWLRFMDFGRSEADDFSVVFRRTIYGSNDAPVGRLICEASTIGDAAGGRTGILTFTVRGPPSGSGLAEAIEFLKRGRDAIVMEFTARTTDSAHEKWGRVK
jgi:uncharacterized protein (TIGR04255 family)